MHTRLWISFSIPLMLSATAAPVFAQPQATAPYQLTVFAAAPTGLSAPDSIAILGTSVFVGYGDGHQPDGSDGLNSQVVQYDMNGNLQHIYTVHGHNDGLKVDPSTLELWAMQNEDLNPNLVIIKPLSSTEGIYVRPDTARRRIRRHRFPRVPGLFQRIKSRR